MFVYTFYANLFHVTTLVGILVGWGTTKLLQRVISTLLDHVLLTVADGQLQWSLVIAAQRSSI
jgi:hypothetical protein